MRVTKESNMNFKALFQPQSIAIIGASSREKTVGNDVVKNLVQQGFAGKIMPVNPKIDELYGVRVYHDVFEIDEQIDLVVVAIPAALVAAEIVKAAAKGCQAAVVISAGFKEMGHLEREQELAAVCAKHNVTLVGPNCLGAINPAHKMNASFAAIMPAVGPVAFISQSGALCTAVLDYARDLGIGFSKFLSIGNKAALSELALIEYLHQDPDTKVICLYAEALDNARAIIDKLRQLNRGAHPKPVIMLKSGKTSEGAGAIASHTGSLSTGDNAYQALFAQAGIIRANSISELFDLAQAFSLNTLSKVSSVAILTNAGGPGVLTTDAVIESGLQLADLTPITVEKLHTFLPAAASTHNPVDVLGDAGAALYKQAIDVLIDDPQTDALIVLLTPQSMTEVSATAQAIIEARQKSDKPIVVSFMGRDLVKEGVELLRSRGIAVTAFPEPAARALALIGQFASFSQEKNQVPNLQQDVDAEKVAAIFAKAKENGQTSFPEAEAMEIMRAYNFPILRSQVATSAEEAENIAREFNCQLVMKIVSPDILHKSDVGGVKLNISADQAKQAYQDMMTTVSAKLPQADLQGVLLMEMATPGVELALGVNKTDLGTVIMLGLGGVYIEILKDVNFAFAPLVREDILRMVKSLRSYKLLEGARGSAAVDQESLVQALERLSQLVTDFPQITELDINPLLINAKGAKVLDVRIVIK